MAKVAFREMQSAHPDATYSTEYIRGFEDGFTDYLTYGGNGQPPYVPPRRYWRLEYQTPEGYAEIQDWFNGFRDGTAVANSSGYRQFVTIPTADGPSPSPAVDTPPVWPPPQPGWPNGVTTDTIKMTPDGLPLPHFEDVQPLPVNGVPNTPPNAGPMPAPVPERSNFQPPPPPQPPVGPPPNSTSVNLRANDRSPTIGTASFLDSIDPAKTELRAPENSSNTATPGNFPPVPLTTDRVQTSPAIVPKRLPPAD